MCRLGDDPEALYLDLVPDLAIMAIMEVNIHEAKTHLSRLLERVAMGEEVVIAKAGTPVAKLVAVKPAARKFKLGSAKGEFTVPEDFNDPLPKEIEDLFWK
jgi:prevent-host-death family protein